MNGKDSAFLDEMKQLAWVVYQDPFWSAQVGQVDITFDRKFELIPVVGNHVIRLGDGQGLKDKLQRLLLFYQKVLAKTGFNKYGAVDVQFEGQVIGIRKGTVSTVDSLQLQQNIAELLKKSTLQNVTTDMLPDAAAASRTDTVTSNIPKPVQPAAAPVKTSTSPVVRTNPTPVKPKRAAVQQNTAPPKKTPARITSRQPRAVMPRSSRQEAVNSRQ
jgi:cell division protein FtsQ